MSSAPLGDLPSPINRGAPQEIRRTPGIREQGGPPSEMELPPSGASGQRAPIEPIAGFIVPGLGERHAHLIENHIAAGIQEGLAQVPQMETEKAGELLQNAPNGKAFIYQKPTGEFRIAFKKNGEVEIRALVFRDGKIFHMNRSYESEEALFAAMGGLQKISHAEMERLRSSAPPRAGPAVHRMEILEADRLLTGVPDRRAFIYQMSSGGYRIAFNINERAHIYPVEFQNNGILVHIPYGHKTFVNEEAMLEGMGLQKISDVGIERLRRTTGAGLPVIEDARPLLKKAFKGEILFYQKPQRPGQPIQYRVAICLGKTRDPIVYQIAYHEGKILLGEQSFDSEEKLLEAMGALRILTDKDLEDLQNNTPRKKLKTPISTVVRKRLSQAADFFSSAGRGMVNLPQRLQRVGYHIEREWDNSRAGAFFREVDISIDSGKEKAKKQVEKARIFALDKVFSVNRKTYQALKKDLSAADKIPETEYKQWGKRLAKLADKEFLQNLARGNVKRQNFTAHILVNKWRDQFKTQKAFFDVEGTFAKNPSLNFIIDRDEFLNPPQLVRVVVRKDNKLVFFSLPRSTLMQAQLEYLDDPERFSKALTDFLDLQRVSLAVDGMSDQDIKENAKKIGLVANLDMIGALLLNSSPKAQLLLNEIMLVKFGSPAASNADTPEMRLEKSFTGQFFLENDPADPNKFKVFVKIGESVDELSIEKRKFASLWLEQNGSRNGFYNLLQRLLSGPGAQNSYALTVNVETLKTAPSSVLHDLAEMFRTRGVAKNLNVTFEGGRGFDAGGLGRELVASLVSGLKDELEFKEVGESGLYRPALKVQTSPNQPPPPYTEETKQKYRELGQLLMFCLNSATPYPTGMVFDEGVFTAIKSFTDAHLAVDFDELLKDPDAFNAMLQIYIKMNQHLDSGKVAQSRAVYVNPITERSSVDELKAAFEASNRDLKLQTLNIDPNDPDSLRKNWAEINGALMRMACDVFAIDNIDSSDPENYPKILEAARKEILEQLRPELAPIHEMARGMKEATQFQHRVTFDRLRTMNPDKISERLQGKVTKENVLNALTFQGVSTKHQRWLKEWIEKASEPPGIQLRHFVRYVTGSPALGNEKIKIQGENVGGFSSHTCFNRLDVPKGIKDKQTFMDYLSRDVATIGFTTM